MYRGLPEAVREVADKNFSLLKSNQAHPSLRFKRVGKGWSVRVGEGYRAVGMDVSGGIQSIWIGTHAQYDRFIR